MTSEEVKAIVSKIISDYNPTPDMEDDLKKLVDSVDEREGMEKVDTTEYDTKISDLERQLSESKQKYIDRFFGGTKEEVDEIKEETKEDVDRDGTVQTFEDLFEEREG